MASIGAFNGSSSILQNATPIQFRAVNFKQQNEVAVTKTASGRIIRSTAATTLFKGTLELVSLSVADFKQIQGFIAKAKTSVNDFTIEIPEISFRTATHSLGTVTVQGSFGQGSTSVNLTKATGGTGTAFNMGDVIKFSGHSKVYMITEKCEADASPFDVSFEPALVLQVSTSETVTYDNVPFKVIMSSDLQEYQYNVDGTVNYRMDVEEVI
jgi:hypothetical protein|tara:strand:- start:8319 stop:8954 length:636 start_codon:yes stop_codon:yes gene_type:complete